MSFYFLLCLKRNWSSTIQCRGASFHLSDVSFFSIFSSQSSLNWQLLPTLHDFDGQETPGCLPSHFPFKHHQNWVLPLHPFRFKSLSVDNESSTPPRRCLTSSPWWPLRPGRGGGVWLGAQALSIYSLCTTAGLQVCRLAAANKHFMLQICERDLPHVWKYCYISSIFF